MTGGFHESTVPWKDMETIRLMSMYKEMGGKWSYIGKVLGRSQNSVRNKFQRIQRPASTTKAQKCRACGLKRRGHICALGSSPVGVDVFPFPEYPECPSDKECDPFDLDEVLDMYDGEPDKL